MSFLIIKAHLCPFLDKTKEIILNVNDIYLSKAQAFLIFYKKILQMKKNGEDDSNFKDMVTDWY